VVGREGGTGGEGEGGKKQSIKSRETSGGLPQTSGDENKGAHLVSWKSFSLRLGKKDGGERCKSNVMRTPAEGPAAKKERRNVTTQGKPSSSKKGKPVSPTKKQHGIRRERGTTSGPLCWGKT